MDQKDALKESYAYFSDKLKTFGATPQGVDWNSEQSQTIRFIQLVRLIDPTLDYSLIDYGCGYGGLLDHLLHLGQKVTYYGYDIVEEMVAEGQRRHAAYPACTFTNQESDLPVCDYGVTSGIFNIKFNHASDAEWTQFVLNFLYRLDRLTKKGFAFNMLTSYSDSEHMKPHLYYGDPCYYFDYCKRNFARNVVLLHDYELYDFTILVRK